MLKARIPALALGVSLAFTGAAAIGCSPYHPSQGLKARALAACTGYWKLVTNGYPASDPRFHASYIWINTDRRPTC